MATAARAAAAEHDMVLALAAGAELAAACDASTLAVRLIGLAIAQGKLEAAPRRELQLRLRSLPPPAGAPLTLDRTLALIAADGAAGKR